jgi:penicillin-binding protein 1A
MGEKKKPRLKKLRILFVLLGLGVLAVVSMVFGMMAAVSQDLPAIYNFAEFKASKNSEVYDDNGEPIGTLTSDQNKILLNSSQISPNVKNAVVSIEDARFYEHNGVDFQGIGRALVKDILAQSAAQGASTITEQFVKNALEAEGSRTVLEKFREAALA